MPVKTQLQGATGNEPFFGGAWERKGPLSNYNSSNLGHIIVI